MEAEESAPKMVTEKPDLEMWGNWDQINLGADLLGSSLVLLKTLWFSPVWT